MLDPKVVVNAKTEVYGIFGDPVRHSLSPLIHNTLFEEFKINAVYTAFQVEPPLLGLAFEAIRALGIKGVNITIPHKEAAMGFVDEIPDDLDRCVGAINTIVNKDGMLFGYNTDGRGFLTALHEELSFKPEGKTVLVLGAGGAARGVAFAVARAYADRILIYNRTRERAEGLGGYLNEYFPKAQVEIPESLESLKKEKIDLVINATSLGMKESDPLPADLNFLSKAASVYDLIYAPAETRFLKLAKKLGLPCTNGLGMLAAQAAFAFELWTGKTQGVRSRMLEVLKKCQS